MSQPSQRAGEPLKAFQVGLFDADGNPVSLDGILITVSSLEVELLGDTSLETAEGVATFTNVFTHQAGTNFTLMASAEGLESAVSNRFTVDPAAPGSSNLLFNPSDMNQGDLFDFQVEVTVDSQPFRVVTQAGSNWEIATVLELCTP